MTLTETNNGATTYTKRIHNNVLFAIVEPTFSDNEFSAVVSDQYAFFIEKFFTNEDDAHLFVMKQIVKLSK